MNGPILSPLAGTPAQTRSTPATEAADGVFGEIAELAAQLCGAAYATITLSDGREHRAIAEVGGLALLALPRDSRFCCEVLHAGAPLEVSDAHFDLRFHDDPLVIRAPRIRFYSGVPLVTETGGVIGTLSVLDERPKVLSGGERGALWKLADVVVRLLADIAARRDAEESLSWQATHDTLTELANRRQFEAMLARQLESARGQGQRHAVLYVDLDQFKVVNDTCGHQAGDRLLRDLTGLLQTRVRTSDTIARLGGDEFGVLLEGCTREQATRIAENVRQAIRDFRFVWGASTLSVGASIGIVQIRAETENVTSVMSAADIACYAAKDAGRNRIHVYEADGVSNRHREMQWVSRVTRAVEDDRLELFFQPIVALGASAARGFHELTVRLRDDGGELVPPSEFIPAAERYNVMSVIDRWVVTRAIEQLDQRRRRGEALPLLAVNLSGTSLNEQSFVDFVLQTVGDPQIAAALCFEITETAAVTSLSNARYLMSELKGRGCKFSLDDFGTGLSSFVYLKTLPVDYLKIDGQFISHIAQDPVNRSMVEAISKVGRALGIATVAECVESEAVLEELRRIGVDFAQGFHLAHPLPIAELPK
ncbi:MAG TPA: EAL domain-containing protein [Steroidobacteraceae bacterium]|nr:EAL domain-containing protein [Steroidobacteraceae bacterium]